MNKLKMDAQIKVIGALVEGCSIRSVERMTGIHRDTIMRLGLRVGDGCKTLLDAAIRAAAAFRSEQVDSELSSDLDWKSKENALHVLPNLVLARLITEQRNVYVVDLGVFESRNQRRAEVDLPFAGHYR